MIDRLQYSSGELAQTLLRCVDPPAAPSQRDVMLRREPHDRLPFASPEVFIDLQRHREANVVLTERRLAA
ncbi:MAG: hypothetical protein ACE5F1_12870 [Planctomycetota bacterium]